MTTVHNVHECPKDWKSDPAYVYIGRSAMYGPRGYGNPYVVGKDGKTRDEVLCQYLNWLQVQLGSNTSFLPRIYELYGKKLVCHCAPEPCHGDFLAHIANGMGEFEGKRNNKEWNDITATKDHERRVVAGKLVNECVLNHGRRIRSEMSRSAERAATEQLAKCVDPMVQFKEWRRIYLDPLLKWNWPIFKAPEVMLCQSV